MKKIKSAIIFDKLNTYQKYPQFQNLLSAFFHSLSTFPQKKKKNPTL